MVLVYGLASLVGATLTVAALWPVLGPWSLVAYPFGGSAAALLVACWLVRHDLHAALRERLAW